MISASANLKNIFYKNSSVDIGIGGVIEYNMNQMLDNIVANYDSSLEANYTKSEDGKVNLFKKIFPIDSILKPFRPVNSGVKYYIMLNNDHSGSNDFEDYRNAPYYINSKPRLYYAGPSNSYKYWVTPENGAVDVTVQYSIKTATIQSAYSTGNVDTYPNRVIYTTSSPHGFIVGNKVSISGCSASSLNLSNKEIIAVPESNKFIVSDTVAYANGTGGTATLRKSDGSAERWSKPALANKIVVKFEKYHLSPGTCNLTITYSDDTVATGTTNITVPPNGTLILYYNGTSWTTSPSYSSAQAVSFANPKEIKSIRLTTSAAGSGRVIGLIEISARWQKDISLDIIDLNIQKESNSDDNSLLPVGFITANSMQMSLARYNQSNLRILTYNRDDDWTTTPTVNDVIYMTKNMEINPFIKVFHANGAVTEGSLKYDRVQQGTFYLDSHEINTYGNTSVTALDGAKYLMETIPVNLLLKDASAAAVIMCLLDTVGFTNYNFNIENPDTSIPNIKLWWTDDNNTTWEHLQEICKDIQMNAFFDESNVLQFYSRNVMYQQETFQWNFYQSETTVGGDQRLPNIIDFNKKELASANEVRIIWKVPESSTLENNAEALWQAPTSYLVSGGLREKILSTTPAELVSFSVDTQTLISEIISSFNFSGYFLVNSEIFEYDAIEYQYMPLGGSVLQTDWVTSRDDLSKINSISDSDYLKIKPTGRYRIKNRALFGTSAATHEATSGANSQWTVVDEEWDI